MSRLADDINGGEGWLQGQMDVAEETFDIEVKGADVMFRLVGETSWYQPMRVDEAIRKMKQIAREVQKQREETKQTLLELDARATYLRVSGKTIDEVFKEMGYTRTE